MEKSKYTQDEIDQILSQIRDAEIEEELMADFMQYVFEEGVSEELLRNLLEAIDPEMDWEELTE